jgi:peroxiredoxin
MNKTLLLLTVLTLVIAKATAQSYKVTGKLTGFKNGTKVSLVDEDDGNTINTTSLKQGTFALRGKLKNGPQYFSFVLHQGNEDYDCTVFTGAGPVSIKGSKKEFDKVIIIGPSEQTAYNSYRRAVQPYSAKMIKVAHHADKVANDSIAYKKAFAQYQAIAIQIDSVNKIYTLNHPANYYAADHLFPSLKEISRDSATRLYNAMSIPVKKSIYGQRIHTYLTLGDTLKINDRYVDFEATNQFGKQQKLSDIKGKYILLDFSFAACNPCHQSIPELRFLSKKYTKVLEVVSFTVDNQKNWLKGVKNDQICWLSLYDGKGNYSKAVLKYGVEGYPTFVLISPQGTILDKWVGYDKTAKETKPIEQHVTKHMQAL